MQEQQDRARRRQTSTDIVTYLERTITAIGPGQEADLDRLERDLEAWLGLNGATEHRPTLACKVQN